MPRRKIIQLEDQELPGLEDVAQDPAPTATRTRAPRKATRAVGNRGKIATRTPAGRVMSKAAMVAQVRGEVGMYLDLMHAGWEARDPVCAAHATRERLDTIADRFTSMIARSDKLLATATKTGILGDIIALLHAVLPIATAVVRAHGPAGTGHESVEEIQRDYAAQYPPTVAYSG